jgi:hypothetical protein
MAARRKPYASDLSWLRTVKAGAQIVLDPRFDGLLSAAVPDVEATETEDVRNDVRLSLWVAEDSPAAVEEGRYVVFSGCKPHDCSNTGFIWVDLAANAAIAGNGDLFSRTIDAQHIPPRFWEDVVHRVIPGMEITYRGPDGKPLEITVPE